MNTVEDVVHDTVQNFINNNLLFTALDVSNKVRESLPLARHREVRDLVRGIYHSVIETANYCRTPITVTLSDGSTAEALLYHPLGDAWDLDLKYDDQCRAQTANYAKQLAATGVSNPVSPSLAPVPAVVVKSNFPTATDASVVNDARTAWDSLFKSQPSLFPRR